MLKRMKKQLNDASDYHHQKVTELDQREKCQVSGQSYVGRSGYQLSLDGEQDLIEPVTLLSGTSPLSRVLHKICFWIQCIPFGHLHDNYYLFSFN